MEAFLFVKLSFCGLFNSRERYRSNNLITNPNKQLIWADIRSGSVSTGNPNHPSVH